MVSDNLLWYSEMSNDLVEYKLCCHFTIGFEGRHCLFPLCEVVYIDNDIFVPPRKNWVAHHVIYPSLGEGPYHDDVDQRSGMQLYFSGIELTRMKTLYSFHTIFKYCGPKIIES